MQLIIYLMIICSMKLIFFSRFDMFRKKASVNVMQKREKTQKNNSHNAKPVFHSVVPNKFVITSNPRYMKISDSNNNLDWLKKPTKLDFLNLFSLTQILNSLVPFFRSLQSLASTWNLSPIRTTFYTFVLLWRKFSQNWVHYQKFVINKQCFRISWHYFNKNYKIMSTTWNVSPMSNIQSVSTIYSKKLQKYGNDLKSVTNELYFYTKWHFCKNFTVLSTTWNLSPKKNFHFNFREIY